LFKLRRMVRGRTAGLPGLRSGAAPRPGPARSVAAPDSADQPWQHKRNVLETAIAFSIANNISGDYLEFGVFQGRSFAHAYRYRTRLFERYRVANARRSDDPFLTYRMRFVAFDSFEGLPASDQSDIPVHWRGDSAMACDQPTFRRTIEAAGVEMGDVRIVPGFFEQTLTPALLGELGLEAAALVHVDCDLESSTNPILEFITPLIVDGTVVVFDDWFYYRGRPDRGEHGAFAAWLSRHPEFIATELARTYPAAAFILNPR
jgi:O-methyltransferase